MKIKNYREKFLFNLLFILLTMSIFRTFYLTSISNDINLKSSNRYYRGNIISSDNVILSFNIDNNKLLLKQNEQLPLKEISEIINIPEEMIQEKLKKQKKITLVAENLSKTSVSQLQKLDNSNIVVNKVPKRYHPYPQILSNTLGFIGYDNKGITGLEAYYNSFLLTSKKNEQHNIILGIDLELQKTVEQMLDKKIQEENATGGFIIIQEIKTGLIKSLAIKPSFNLNNFTKTNPKLFTNNVVSNVLEPGSVMKSLFIPYLIENNIVNEEERFKTEGYIKLINEEVINDTAPPGNYNLADIIRLSSNAGLILAMDRISKEEMYDFLKTLHFFEKTNIDLPAETFNIIPPLNKWGLRTIATVPIGHGVALSPISIITTFNAILNNGKYVEPRIVQAKEIIIDGNKSVIPTKIKYKNDVISEETSKKMVELLYNGTTKGSTGAKANRKYISIGKSGTSKIIDNKKKTYTNKFYTFFIGAYPYNNPTFSIFVGVYKPQKHHGGGSVSAPLYADVLEKAIERIKFSDSQIISAKNTTLNKVYDFNMFKTQIMPSFTGMSLRNTLITTNILKTYLKEQDINVHFEISGSKGYVTNQSIPKGRKLNDGDNIKIEIK